MESLCNGDVTGSRLNCGDIWISCSDKAPNGNNNTVTKLLEKAVDAARTWPADMQDEIARIMLMFAGEEQPVLTLDADEDRVLELSEAEAANGEFASDEDVRAVWAKHGL